MAKKKTEPEIVYHLVNRDKSKHGVVSSVPNCGYTEDQLKNMAKYGWKIKEERVK